MNESGIWTGILNNKLGTFKFINVNIIETYRNFLSKSTTTLNNYQTKLDENISKLNELNDYNKKSGEEITQKLTKLTKSSTFSSLLFQSTTSLASTPELTSKNRNICCNHSNSNINLINNDFVKIIESSKINNSTLINEILDKTKLKVSFLL